MRVRSAVKEKPLSKQYRYRHDRGRVWLEPVPQAGPAAHRFIAETKLIAMHLWGEGASLDSVFTGGTSALAFQNNDTALNLRRAHEVARRWREFKRAQAARGGGRLEEVCPEYAATVRRFRAHGQARRPK